MTWEDLLAVLETLKGDVVLKEPVRFFSGESYSEAELQRSMHTGSMLLIPSPEANDVE